MGYRKTVRLLAVVVPTVLGACATYVPPAPAPTEDFSRTIDGSYDRSWSAVTYVAGASFFRIKAFEKASGLMTLDFELKDVLPYVDCGNAVNNTTHQTTPALLAIGAVAFSLNGTANINIRSEGSRRTAIQFNSQYTLDAYRPNPYGGLIRVAEWQFNSGSSDTQNIVGTLIVCRPSYKIERDFLTEVSARL